MVYRDCPYGCPTPPLTPGEYEYHMQWHADEQVRELVWVR